MATTADRPATTNTDLAERFIADIWNGADVDSIETLTPPDLVVHQLGGDVERTSRDDFRNFLEEFRDAVPNLTHNVDRTVAEGDYVIVYESVTGTPERQYEAMRPTDKSFDVPAFQMFRIEDGRIVEAWILPSVVQTMRQLDLLPDSPGKLLRMVLFMLKRRLTE